MVDNEFTEQLRNITDEELIERFNKDVGNPGWVAARGRFHHAMSEEFVRRGFDYTAIGDEHSLSWAQKIELNGKLIKIIELTQKS